MKECPHCRAHAYDVDLEFCEACGYEPDEEEEELEDDDTGEVA